ncbi:hypothetical protein V6N13_083147 [Hibiscus sabdariffa]
MIEKGCALTIRIYGNMINEYRKAKRLDKAMELFHEISQNGPTSDIVTYNTLMQGWFIQKRGFFKTVVPQKATQLLREMELTAFFIGMAVPCQLQPVFSTTENTESESSILQHSTAKNSTFHSLKAEAIGRSQSTTPVVASFA